MTHPEDKDKYYQVYFELFSLLLRCLTGQKIHLPVANCDWLIYILYIVIYQCEDVLCITTAYLDKIQDYIYHCKYKK